jgi:hypothetical protein
MLDKRDLLLYELPEISKYADYGWMREIIAKYLAWKINRKYARYLYRLDAPNRIQKMKDELSKLQ